MRDVYEPFQTYVENHPDFDRRDERRAVELQLLRDDLIFAYLQGEQHLDTVLDCLAETDLDPLLWLDEAVVGVERIVDSGIEFYQDESGLLLPR